MATANEMDALLDEVTGRLGGEHTHGLGRDHRQMLALQVDIALSLRIVAASLREISEKMGANHGALCKTLLALHQDR